MRKVILQIIKRPGEILRLDCRRKLPRHSPRISGSEPSVSVDCPVAQQFKILHVMASWQVGALECIRHAPAVQAVLCTAVDDFGRWHRSEERRVGKEGVSTCRSRWSPNNSTYKKTHHTQTT